MSKPPNQEDIDKPIQDAADNDNYQTVYACAVKPQMMATIDSQDSPSLQANIPSAFTVGTARRRLT